MALSEKDIELIQKYLGDTISAQDKLSFDLRLKDSEFQKELLLHSKAIDALAEQDRRSVVEFLHADKSVDTVQEPESQKKPAKNRWMLFGLGFLMGLLIVMGLKYFTTNEDDNKAETTYMAAVESFNKPYPFLIVGRGEGEIDPARQKAYEAYSKGEYRNALAYFENRVVENEDLNLVKANCHLQLKEYDQAIELFSNLKNSNTKTVAQNAEWYLALTEMLNGNIAAGKTSVENISKNNAHLFSDQALKLLDRIK